MEIVFAIGVLSLVLVLTGIKKSLDDIANKMGAANELQKKMYKSYSEIHARQPN